jgi:hypothetical protein
MQGLKQRRIPNCGACAGLVAAIAFVCSLIVGCGSTGVAPGGGTGGGGGSTLTASPLTVQFGNVLVNATVPPQVLTFTNPSSSGKAVTISQLQFGGTNASSFSLAQTPTLPLTVNPGQSVSASIQVSATAAGPLAATLTITSDATPSSLSINLSATGVNPAPAASSLSPNSAVSGSPATTLTVRGSGFPRAVEAREQ